MRHVREDYPNQSKLEGCLVLSVSILIGAVVVGLAGVNKSENQLSLLLFSILMSLTSIAFAIFGLILKIPGRNR